MQEDFLGLELMELYRSLRAVRDPAVKAVIRRRIDSRLADRDPLALPLQAPVCDPHQTGAD